MCGSTRISTRSISTCRALRRKRSSWSYEVDIDLPGFAKEEIKLELNNGYLTINAEKNLDQNKEKHGKLIRQERYSGSMQRSFYVGEEITEEDVKASFQHGVLKLLIPKKEKRALPEKKTIAIEESQNRQMNSRGISPGCFLFDNRLAAKVQYTLGICSYTHKKPRTFLFAAV